MKNMRISKKLILGFLIVTAFSVVLAGIGIISTSTINNNYKYLNDSPIERQTYLRAMQLDFMTMRYRAANFVMNTGDLEMINGTLVPQYNSAYTSFQDNLNKYIANNNKDDRRDAAVLKKNSEDAASLAKLVGQYKTASDNTLALSIAGDAVSADLSLKAVISLSGDINTLLSDMISPATDYVYTTENDMAQFANTLTIVQVSTAIICIALSLFLAFYISTMITRPLNHMRDGLVKLSTTGDLSVNKEENSQIRSRDEIGQCIEASAGLIARLTEINNDLGKVAHGDLTVDLRLLSDKDSMGLAINQMIESLSGMFEELAASSGQVASGAGQISQGAQALATGSSQQAASVQQLSNSLSEVSSQVDNNAERSKKALKNCDISGNLMENSMESMNQMLEAMSAIDESSRNITRVIKVIDDIAFQTNILALNAAVEAARAGQHGKGFAVVAEEVRNLASKSAEAANETAALIDISTERVSEGSRIVEQTNENMKAVGVTTGETAALINEMARSLEQQRTAVLEINQGMGEISNVVQANAATSEQSAASAEELSAQSVVLNEITSRFKLKQYTGLSTGRAAQLPRLGAKMLYDGNSANHY